MKQCQKCERPKTIVLVGGESVCNYCEAWRMECEARSLLRLPLKERRSALVAREYKRGSKAVLALKQVMIDVFHHQTAQKNKR